MLNLWFLLPMIYLLGADGYHLQQEFGKEIQHAGTQLAGVFQLWPNAGSNSRYIYDGEPIQIGAAAIGCLLLFFAMAMVNKKYRDKACLCMWSLTLLALVLSTRYFPWNMLSTLPGIKSFVTSLQFPTRIMIMASIFAAMFAAVFLTWFVREEGTRAWICVGVLLMLTVGSSLYQTNDILLERGSTHLYTTENMGTTSSWSRNFIFVENEQTEFSYHPPVADKDLLWWGYDKRGTHVSIYVKNESTEVRYLELPLLGYKGYGIMPQSQTDQAPIIADEKGNHGDLKISVPAGYEGKLDISYQGMPLFAMAEWLSLISLILAVSIEIAFRKRRLKYGAEAEKS